jgi:hypothetical protein
VSIAGRRIAVGITADGEIDLIRAMVDLLRPLVDRFVIVEGTRTFSGEPREVLGVTWRTVLDLDDDNFRYVTAQLPGPGSSPSDIFADARKRGMLQRNALGLAVRDLAPDDILLSVDADEFVDPAWLEAHAAALETVMRLRMVPLYGGLDRRAPDWHCCLDHLTSPIGAWPPRETEWLYEGSVIGPIRELVGRGVQGWRARPDSLSAEAAGWHLLHILPAYQDPVFKIERQGHQWQGTSDSEFVARCLVSGVHRSGWWGATSGPIPPALAPIAQKFPATVLGPLPALNQRESLLLQARERFNAIENPTGQNQE